jgi:uncharacterized protein DUF6166
LTSTERYYSGKALGEVMVREEGLTRLLEPRDRPFTWGRDQSGAAELALALLSDALGDETAAKRFHEHFSHRVVSNFPERWTITRTRILAHVKMMKFQESRGAL